MDVNYTVSSEFKKAGSKVVLIPLKINENGVPDFAQLDKNYAAVHQMIMNRKVLAAHTVRSGGISEAISKMCFGNMIGFKFEASVDARRLFEPLYGSIVLELDESLNLDELLKDVEYEFLGVTQENLPKMAGAFGEGFPDGY